MSSTIKKFSVFKLPIHLSNNYSNWLLQRLEQKVGSHVITLNAEMAILTEKNQALADVIKQADLVIPDGSGVIFYLLLRGKWQKRCPGIELAQSLLTEFAQFTPSYPICFYGGKPGVTETAAQNWQQKLPNLLMIINHGYLSPEEITAWEQVIQDTQPKLILVGLGVPRQEFWIAQNRHLSPEAIWIGVGGSFDIWAGVKSRAPVLFQKLHLEWLYRLYQEPWRWKRMMALPQFFWRSLAFWQ